MERPTLFELIADRRTRVRALEIAVIAHAIVDPVMIPRSVAIRLSEPAAFALRVILGALTRTSIVAQLQIAVTDDPLTAPAFATEVMELTVAAAVVTIEELANVGSLYSVIKNLASERSRRANNRRARQAA